MLSIYHLHIVEDILRTHPLYLMINTYFIKTFDVPMRDNVLIEPFVPLPWRLLQTIRIVCKPSFPFSVIQNLYIKTSNYPPQYFHGGKVVFTSRCFSFISMDLQALHNFDGHICDHRWKDLSIMYSLFYYTL